jgi:hypothetical protein
MMLRGCFESKGPKHCVNHLGPHLHSMKKKRTGGESKNFVLILYNSVLMMRANTTESNLLIFAVDFL